MRKFKFFAIIIFMLIVSQLLCSLSRKLVFPGNKETAIPKIGNGKLISLSSETRIASAYFSRNKKSDKLVVFFHGNGEAFVHQESIALKIFEQGYSVLLIEYPGYGISAGYEVSEKNIYSDSELLIKYCQQIFHFSTATTFFWGRSLGTGISIEMLKRKLGSKAVLVSSYTSIPEVGDKLFVPFLPGLIIQDKFATIDKAEKIKAPLLMLHGMEDRLVPFSMSVRLNEKFSNSQLIAIVKAGHNDIYLHFSDKIWENVFEFLKK